MENKKYEKFREALPKEVRGIIIQRIKMALDYGRVWEVEDTLKNAIHFIESGVGETESCSPYDSIEHSYYGQTTVHSGDGEGMIVYTD